MRATTEYINRLMVAGLFINDVQYRFYHHSNSQLVGQHFLGQQPDS
jgi:regulator of nonsense transcripts 1